MTLREELRAFGVEVPGIGYTAVLGTYQIDVLVPWLAQKLREAEAVAVERCAQAVPDVPKPHENADSFVRRARLSIRSLSPDPDFLECERLRARLAEANFWRDNAGDHAGLIQRIAELQRQLEALKEAGDGTE